MKSERKKLNLLVMVLKTHFVFFLIFFPLIRPISAYGNLAKNPSMEGNFIFQGPIGDVAEDWTGWEQLRGTYDLKGEFSEGDVAHEGSKSQKITWDNPYPSSSTGDASFGYDYIYQQIDSLQSGKLYRASVWFKGTMGDSFPFEGFAGFSLFGAIGAEADGGTDPGAVSHWSWTWMQWNFRRSGDNPFPAWYNLSVPFSPNGSKVSVFVRMYGHAQNYSYFYDPYLGYVYTPHPWHVDCYIDDVVVELVQIGQNGTVEATSPIWANGVDYSEVTITVVNPNGEPLAGVPASGITVNCTGSGNTVVGPDAPTDANGRTTARITSTVAETKTVSVTVFGTVLSDTAVVEFTGGPFGPIWYVDADAIGADDGSSWADAFNHLQDALFAAQIGHEIHVAQGIYKPNEGLWVGAGREETFQLINGVTIKGGYAGFGEPAPNARDVNLFETILSGDRAGNDGPNFSNNDENSYHVVTSSGTDATAVLDGFTITGGNTFVNGGGGGLLNFESSSPTILNCKFTANKASFGGGVCNYDNCSPTLSDCTFNGNTAGHGGGMYNSVNSSPTLTNCTFSSNSADNSAAYGGGMTNYSSSPTLTGCTFSGNSASLGGGMYNYENSSPTLSNCTFSGNIATWGGGMCNLSASPTVSDCMFTSNTADEWGGGMLNEANSSVTLTNCTFTGNSAGDGGGVFNFSSSPMLTNCTFSGNLAIIDGGGMLNYDNSPTVVTNCAFSGNLAGEDGGGMYNWGNSPTLTNCTFSGNAAAANGNALACESFNPQAPSNVELANCILWDGGNEIWNNDGSTITITYSDVQGSWTGMGNIDTAPSFVNPGHWDPNGTPADASDDFWVDGDYHLLAGSPCIDAGDNTAVPPDANDIDGDGNTTEPIPLDLDGKPRFSDDPDIDDTGSGTPPIVDIGAYEFQGISLITGDFCGANFGPADGYVDVWDLMLFADHWHTRTGDSNWDSMFDLAGPNFGDLDGYVDVWDLMVFADHWHEGVKP